MKYRGGSLRVVPCLLIIAGYESDRVPGSELAKFPEFIVCHNDWTNEAAETGSVGTEQNRHVAGEVHCADSVGIVVDVGWMKSRLTAVFSGPSGARADQPHACSVRVVMDLP